MTIKGNLIDLAEIGKFDVIVHGCNCFHTMGAGIAKEISFRYPEVLTVDKDYTTKGDKSKLGGFTFVRVKAPNKHGFIIINAYTQYHYGKPKKNKEGLVDYKAITEVFHLLSNNFQGLRIGYPKIGAGLAGGNWRIIKTIIDTELVGFNHQLVIL